MQYYLEVSPVLANDFATYYEVDNEFFTSQRFTYISQFIK